MRSPGPDVETLFSEARLKLTAEERSAYLEGACGDNDRLRRRVEALLAAEEAAGEFQFLEEDVDAVVEDVGAVIGDYKLREQ